MFSSFTVSLESFPCLTCSMMVMLHFRSKILSGKKKKKECFLWLSFSQETSVTLICLHRRVECISEEAAVQLMYLEINIGIFSVMY